jgi:hypothetical protein
MHMFLLRGEPDHEACLLPWPLTITLLLSTKKMSLPFQFNPALPNQAPKQTHIHTVQAGSMVRCMWPTCPGGEGAQVSTTSFLFLISASLPSYDTQLTRLRTCRGFLKVQRISQSVQPCEVRALAVSDRAACVSWLLCRCCPKQWNVQSWCSIYKASVFISYLHLTFAFSFLKRHLRFLKTKCQDSGSKGSLDPGVRMDVLGQSGNHVFLEPRPVTLGTCWGPDLFPRWCSFSLLLSSQGPRFGTDKAYVCSGAMMSAPNMASVWQVTQALWASVSSLRKCRFDVLTHIDA